jgi:hypothetical protein
MSPTDSPPEELPFSIELWDAGSADTVERIIARAFSAELAKAIFVAAQTEYPERRLTLRRGTQVLSDSQA